MTHVNVRRTAPALLALAVALPVLLGACSKSNDTAVGTNDSTTTTGGAINAGPTVEISELKFTPSSAEAKVGQTVTWVNKGSAKHQVQETPAGATASSVAGATTAKPLFESELMKPDSTYVFTPTAAGTYSYICRIHPQEMQGTLTVK